jgi:hypothetical protein
VSLHRSAPFLVAAVLTAWGAVVHAAPAVSRPVYDALERVGKLVARSEVAPALAALSKLQETTASGSYDRAVVLRTLASVRAQQGDYGQAATALGESLAQGALSAQETAQARQDLARLQAAARNPAGQRLRRVGASAAGAPGGACGHP